MARPRLISDEQIIATTRECVLARGPHVSIDAIAERLGVTGPALLKRFGNRQELLLKSLLPDPNAPWLHRFDLPPDGRPLEAQLRDHLQATWDFFLEMIPCITALRESGIPQERMWPSKHDGPLRAMQTVAKWLTRAKDQGLAELSAPDAVAAAMLGAIQHHAFTTYIVNKSFSTRSNREFLDDLAAFFSRALAPVPPVRNSVSTRTRKSK
jgi:AcrR family transcriptional regulator